MQYTERSEEKLRAVVDSLSLDSEACVASSASAAFPVVMAGRLPHRWFRGLLSLHSRCGPRTSLAPYFRGLFSECFSSFRHLVSRPECFRLERQFAGRVFHPHGRCALSRRT